MLNARECRLGIQTMDGGPRGRTSSIDLERDVWDETTSLNVEGSLR